MSITCSKTPKSFWLRHGIWTMPLKLKICRLRNILAVLSFSCIKSSLPGIRLWRPLCRTIQDPKTVSLRSLPRRRNWESHKLSWWNSKEVSMTREAYFSFYGRTCLPANTSLFIKVRLKLSSEANKVGTNFKLTSKCYATMILIKKSSLTHTDQWPLEITNFLEHAIWHWMIW